jgi:hypothetical protein
LRWFAHGRQVSEPCLALSGLTRAAAGASALALSGALAYASARSVALGPVLRIAGVYAAHTGLAALQIGLLRQLGWELPERYRRVYRARSPRDFWPRWNTYVGNWIRIYVFTPCARVLLGRGVDRRSTFALAILFSFAVIGALHDLYATVTARVPSCALTLWFVANAVVLIAWDAAPRPSSRGGLLPTLGWVFIAFALAGTLPSDAQP